MSHRQRTCCPRAGSAQRRRGVETAGAGLRRRRRAHSPTAVLASPLQAAPLLRRRDPFDDPAWLYELKLDGFRALAQVDAGARLVSRNGHRFKAFDPLCAELARVVGRTAVLDGELVCLDPDGRSDFDTLFYRRAEPYFYAFDLLALDGRDLRNRPLLERKVALRRLLGRRRGRVRYLTHVRRRGVALFALVCGEDLEGIVAKRADSRYGVVGEEWVKIKNRDYTGAVGRWERFERGCQPA